GHVLGGCALQCRLLLGHDLLQLEQGLHVQLVLRQFDTVEDFLTAALHVLRLKPRVVSNLRNALDPRVPDDDGVDSGFFHRSSPSTHCHTRSSTASAASNTSSTKSLRNPMPPF